MRRCSRSRVLVPLFAIRLRISSPPALFPASSLAFPLMRLAGSFTTPPLAVSSPLRTSLLTSPCFLAGQPARGDLAAPLTWLYRVVSCRTTLAALGFTPSTADPSLFLRTDTSLPPFYVLVYVDDLIFATVDIEALTLMKSELHNDTLALTWVLQRFGFQFSSPQPTPLSTGHSLSAPPSDESVEPSGPYPELVGCLITSGMGLVLGGQGQVVLTGDANASWVDNSATQRSS
ncbi:unnamed protein product [Closterium sp. NIES-54]